jgi:predicted secreted protein
MAKSIRSQLATVVASIAALEVKKTTLEAELAANPEVNTDLAVAGAVIEFKYGKGTSVKSLTGQVIGRKEPAEGEKGATQLRVAAGEGFDAQLVTIYLPYITKIVSSPATPVEAVAEEAPHTDAPQA